MVSSPMEENLVYNKKLSSVGPGYVTGPDSIFEPGNMDLAMKLHYLRGIYYFESPAFDGLTTLAIKEPMFAWLNMYPMTCGRFRRGESGRAYIKCNDCGVRFIEARCDKSLDEWLEMKDANFEKLLCPSQVIGPELSFSPLVYIQLTKFKCGGTAVGLSWAHVLGDAFSAAEYMNMLGRAAAGSMLDEPIKLSPTLTKSINPNGLAKVVEDPISVKRVDPVGDNWVHIPPCKMEAFSFNVSSTQLNQIQSKLTRDGVEFPPFEALSSFIWKLIARIRVEEMEPRVVTICKRSDKKKTHGTLGNSQIVGVAKADFPIVEADPSELACLVQEALNECERIEEAIGRDNGVSDFIIYGANLTFVDLEEAGFYNFEYRGQKPIEVSCRAYGVGEKGAIFVLPGPKESGKKGGGRLVMAMLPENDIIGLKRELKNEGLIK